VDDGAQRVKRSRGRRQVARNGGAEGVDGVSMARCDTDADNSRPMRAGRPGRQRMVVPLTPPLPPGQMQVEPTGWGTSSLQMPFSVAQRAPYSCWAMRS
jgi:hypothetical protein